jgi:hypothetical protein
MAIHFKKLPLVLILCTIAFLLSVSLAAAQSPTRSVPRSLTAPQAGINLSVSPTFLNLTANPGETVTSQFKVKNNSSFSEHLRVRLAKFEIGAGGKPILSPVSANDTFTKWVEIEEPDFMVSPNQTKAVKFTITPPKEASLGYYYAFVIERVQERESEGTGAIVAGSPALLTLLEVRSPNAKRELQLTEFVTDKVWYEYLPATFTLKVKNSGNVHIVPKGNIFIDYNGKKDIAILAANESRGNILPQTEREYTASWGDGMITNETTQQDGKSVTQTKFDFDKPLSSFRIGKYTANLLLVYDNGERDVPLEASVSFWVIPWKLIGGAILIILAPFILFILIRKMRGRGRK